MSYRPTPGVLEMNNVWNSKSSSRHRRRLGAEFGRDGKNFADQIFDWPFLKKKFPFQGRKFLMTFVVIDSICLFYCLSLLSEILHIIYIPFPLFYFRTKNSFVTTFLLSSYFHTHPITLLLETLGGTDALAVPHLKFWRTVPQSPLSLCPCKQAYVFLFA